MDQDNKNIDFHNKLMMIMGIFMVIVYFSLGIWFVLTDTNIFQINGKQQRLLGIMLVVYGVYRSYILYSRFNKTRFRKN